MNPRSTDTIRRLRPTDAAAFRTLRLDGLARHPEAFGASWEAEVEQPLAWFAATLENHAVFGAWRTGDGLVGIAGLYIPDAMKLRHKGTLWGVFVRPDARRSGIATSLIRAVIDHAATCVEDVSLSVGATNATALRCYEAAGFVSYGLEPRALKIANTYYAEVLMVLPIKQSDQG
ncbi:GNAT family N-acetyltransferase [Methylobacterium sp. J-078]|uniref:GNAT family N-acetyltransferase n=1 Tax=Methylobacterium sp. J-078 TaxID=2836657 RepID=UPI001FB9BD67|nr:GNAT family N-acetyltransferase [Methylobacterium sp. J-078]MCJ2046308.1 GNAT family N-acetyltransferase [Methylobacterium sp. J-078]